MVSVSHSGQFRNIVQWVLGPMLTTMVIYFLFRSHELLYFEIASVLELDAFIVALQQGAEQMNFNPGYVVKYNLPSALWLFAFQSLMLILWSGELSRRSLGWIAIPVFVAVGSELVQLFGLTDGTFDILDLLLYVMASAFSLIAVRSSRQLNLNFGRPIRYIQLTSLAVVVLFTLIIGLADAI